MAKLPLFLALFACILFLPETYSIDVSFSAQDGGGSVSLDSIYSLDDSASANEGVSASFGQVGISDVRSVSGIGNVEASQGYSGSGGQSGNSYSGNSQIHATDANTAISSSASLAPSMLSVSQSTSLIGGSGDVSLSGKQGGESAQQYASFSGGWLNSGQGMIAGHSVYTAQGTSMVANAGTVSSQASANGNQASTGLFGMINPDIVTIQAASATRGIAYSGQASFTVTDEGFGESSADGSNGAHADVGLELKNGLVLLTQGSLAGEGLVPTTNLACLLARGTIGFDAHSNYPSTGFGYLSYGSGIGPGNKIPVTDGKESMGFTLKNIEPINQNDMQKLHQQLDRAPGFPSTIEVPSAQVLGYHRDEGDAPETTLLEGLIRVLLIPIGVLLEDGSVGNGNPGSGVGPESITFNSVAEATSVGCIHADVGNAKKAIILEPMYTAFSEVARMPEESDVPETDGDAVYRYLLDSGYATWRYEDTAATREHFQELNKFDVAVIDSHMNSQVIALSTPSENPDEGQMVTYQDLKNWYTNPPDDALIVLNGCDSSGPISPNIYDQSLFGALTKADVVAGFPGTVYTGWGMNSVSEFFKYMHDNPGSTVIDTDNHVWWDYRPGWETRHFTGPYIQPLDLMGKDSDSFKWTLK